MAVAVRRPERFWVAQLSITDNARRKIAEHRITEDEAREALCFASGLIGDWFPDEWGDDRAVVDVEVRGAKALAVIYPAEGVPWSPLAERWRLRTMYFL